MFGARKKLWISIALCVSVFVGGLLAFVIIPAQLGKFRGADALAAGTNIQSVSGNGGAAVMVGDYLYFTAGYRDKNDIEYKVNEYNKITGAFDGGIWRVKMNSGAPVYDNAYLRNYLTDNAEFFPNWENVWQDLESDQNALPEFNAAFNKSVVGTGVDRIELIVPKIASWQNTAMWIFGNTLVYTSPNNQKDRHGDMQTDKIDFFRCDLRGKDHQKIYTTRSGEVPLENFTVAWAGEPFLLIKDESNLLRVDMKGRVVTVAGDVDTVKFPIISGYYANSVGADLASAYSGMNAHVFFTVANTADDKLHGNKIFSYPYAGKTANMVLQNDSQHKLLAFGNGHLIMQTNYYTGGASKIMVTSDPSLKTREEYSTYALQPTEGTVWVATEMSAANFRFITHDGTSFRVYNPFDNFKQTRIDAPNFSNILCVTSNTIIYSSTGGGEGASTISVNYFDGTETGRANFNAYSGGARISVFRIIDNAGDISTNGGYKLFFQKSISEIQQLNDEGEVADPDAIPETIFVPHMVDAETGFENILASLDTNKFVAFPKKPS